MTIYCSYCGKKHSFKYSAQTVLRAVYTFAGAVMDLRSTARNVQGPGMNGTREDPCLVRTIRLG